MSSGEHTYTFLLSIHLGGQLLYHSKFNISKYCQFPRVDFLKPSVTWGTVTPSHLFTHTHEAQICARHWMCYWNAKWTGPWASSVCPEISPFSFHVCVCVTGGGNKLFRLHFPGSRISWGYLLEPSGARMRSPPQLSPGNTSGCGCISSMAPAPRGQACHGSSFCR